MRLERSSRSTGVTVALGNNLSKVDVKEQLVSYRGSLLCVCLIVGLLSVEPIQSGGGGIAPLAV